METAALWASIKVYKEVLGECGEFLINVSLWFLYVQNQQSAVLYIAGLHIIIIMNISCDLLLTFSRNIFQHKARKPLDKILKTAASYLGVPIPGSGNYLSWPNGMVYKKA